MDREDLISVAMGEVPADLVVKGGKLINVYTSEVYDANIAIKSNRIAIVGNVDETVGKETKILNAKGKYLTPGLIDAHHHVGDLYLTATQLARALLMRGTTAIATDLYETFVVSGIKGVKFALEEASRTPLKILYVVPVHLIGWDTLGTFGTDIKLEEMKEMLSWHYTVGINEPPPASVLSKNQILLSMIRSAREEKKVFVGHACETVGKELNAYINAGATSDHECLTAVEAIEKARLGLRIIAREASSSPDLSNVIEAVTKHNLSPRYISFCSDDISLYDLVHYGHMDHKIRIAIKRGVNPISAVQMATLNAAEAYKVDEDLGSVTPGKIADILLLDDLSNFTISTVIANGKVVVQEGQYLAETKPPTYPDFLRRGLQLKRRIKPEDFAVKVDPNKSEVEVRVIDVEDGTLLKKAEKAIMRVQNGHVSQDVERDIIKISMVERHRATGRIGTAFVRGFGLKKGAVASTFNIIYFNVVVIGTNDRDMSVAVNSLAEVGGGLVAVKDEKILSRLDLPLGGIISEKPAEEASEKLEDVYLAIRSLGCNYKAPDVSLAFVTLTTIPDYGITDRGLVDVHKKAVVNPIIG